MDLSYKDLSQIDLRGQDMRGRVMVGADLRESDFAGTLLDGADLTGASITGARFDPDANSFITYDGDVRADSYLPPSSVEENGGKIYETWVNEHDDLFHNPFEPALKVFSSEGELLKESWYINGVHTREDGPASTEWHENGNIHRELWYQNGEISRIDGPATLVYDENGVKIQETWMKDGEIHRDRGPALITYYPTGEIKEEQWRMRGAFHRTDGPALIARDEEGELMREEWCQNDVLHRPGDEPASTRWKKGAKILEVWAQNGYYIREQNGPAIIHYYNTGIPSRELWSAPTLQEQVDQGIRATPISQQISLSASVLYPHNLGHRVDGPAVVDYYPNGNVSSEEYLIYGKKPENGRVHKCRYYENGARKEELLARDGKLAWGLGERADKVYLDDESDEYYIRANERKWHPNGQLKEECYYQGEGNMPYRRTEWDENGKVLRHYDHVGVEDKIRRQP
jgi:antitoxin component YwqK of YwqJK toxin-antitoxin module